MQLPRQMLRRCPAPPDSNLQVLLSGPHPRRIGQSVTLMLL